MVALNEKALATAIETVVSAAARKHAVRVLSWWAACELNVFPTKDSSALTVPNEVTIDIGFTGEPASVTGVARPVK